MRIGIAGILMAFLLTSCSNVTLTSWTNPKGNQKISKVIVWGMFDKLEYQKPFEQYAAAYFNSRGLKAIESLDFLRPNQKYELADLEKKFDSLGADALLIVTYKSTDKSQTYIPPTTTMYPDYYYNYYNYYSWGYPMYGMGASVVTTGGYWSTTTVINLRANLYGNTDNDLLWTAEIAVDDPEYIDQVSNSIASSVFADWQKNGLLKFTAK
jgi:hypothetical protein